MIGHVMMYLLLVSLVVSAAAWIADEGLRRAGVQTRWLWMLALAAGPLLLLAGALLPAASVSAVARVSAKRSPSNRAPSCSTRRKATYPPIDRPTTTTRSTPSASITASVFWA